jgi:hypothetical protein
VADHPDLAMEAGQSGGNAASFSLPNLLYVYDALRIDAS